MTYINMVSIAKQSQLQEVQLPLLQPFRINEAAGQCKAQNCRAQNSLWQSAGQMLTRLRAPEGVSVLCAFCPGCPAGFPSLSSLCWTMHQKHRRVEAHGCVRFADPVAQQSYVITQFHSYSSVLEWFEDEGVIKKLCVIIKALLTPQGSTCPHVAIQYVK